jgi:hypothetical protein
LAALLRDGRSTDLISCSLGSLWEVSFETQTYQILVLAIKADDHRDFKIEQKRLKEKHILGHTKSDTYHYFIFRDGTFYPSAPRTEDVKKSFKKIRAEAGEAYVECELWEEPIMK